MKSKKAKVEFDKLKTMSLADKWWYIWEYYKIPILSIVGIIFLLVTLVPSIINNRDPVFTCYVINTPIHDPAHSEIESGFNEYIKIDPKDHWEFDSSMVIDWGDSSVGYEYMMKITAVIATKGLDVMIGDEATIEHFSQLSGYMDLEQVFSDEMREKLKDQFHYSTDENGDSKAYAVNLSASPVLKAAGITKPLYFSMVGNSSKPEMSMEFLNYLMGD